jgi:hypothetical protein
VSLVGPRRTLTDLAVVNVVLHVIGLVLALIGMGPGTPLVSLPERLDYLAHSPLGWTVGWVSWMLCSWVLLAFLAVLTQRLGEGAALARLGLTVAVVAAGFDLAADSIFLSVLPELAAATPRNEALFLALERLTGVVSLVVANGGYSVATLLFTIALSKREGLLRFTTAIGFAVAGFGFLLAGAGFTGVAWQAQWATPPTIGLYCVWTLLVARSLESSPRSP